MSFADQHLFYPRKYCDRIYMILSALSMFQLFSKDFTPIMHSFYLLYFPTGRIISIFLAKFVVCYQIMSEQRNYKFWTIIVKLNIVKVHKVSKKKTKHLSCCWYSVQSQQVLIFEYRLNDIQKALIIGTILSFNRVGIFISGNTLPGIKESRVSVDSRDAGNIKISHSLT